MVAVDLLRARRIGFVQLGQHPPFQPREVDVHPVVVDVDVLGTPDQARAIVGGHPITQGPDVVGPKDVAVLEDEGAEELDVLRRLAGDAVDLVESLDEAIDHRREPACPPPRADAPQRLRSFPRDALDLRDRVAVVRRLLDRAELHARRQLVEEAVAGLLVAEALPLVKARQRHHAVHVQRVQVAAR